MEIHALTQFTYKKYRQFRLFSMFRGRYYKLWIFVLYSCPALCAILFILNYLILKMRPTETYLFYIFPFLYSLSYFLIFIYKRTAPSKTLYEKQEKTLSIPNDFTFYEEEFHVVAVNEQYSETTSIKYSFLEKAYETDRAFYLYLTKKTAYPIWKDGIKPNEIDELRTRLMSHLETDKYIRCK